MSRATNRGAVASRRPASRQRGFTLLEVLVALVIATMGLMSVFSAFGASAQSMAATVQYQEALSRARSRLEAVCATAAESENGGDDGGGFRWRSSVRPLGSTARPEEQGPVTTLYAVTVWVSWGENGRARSVRLDTERLRVSLPGAGGV